MLPAAAARSRKVRASQGGPRNGPEPVWKILLQQAPNSGLDFSRPLKALPLAPIRIRKGLWNRQWPRVLAAVARGVTKIITVAWPTPAKWWWPPIIAGHVSTGRRRRSESPGNRSVPIPEELECLKRGHPTRGAWISAVQRASLAGNVEVASTVQQWQGRMYSELAARVLDADAEPSQTGVLRGVTTARLSRQSQPSRLQTHACFEWKRQKVSESHAYA
jgi:hypothetical protein